MIYLQLIIEFIKISLFSFGGGYGTLPFIYYLANEHNWYSTKEIMPWAKSFIGNIISIKGNNQEEIDCINKDLKEIAKIYE